MWISEQVLFLGVRTLYRTEIAHSSEMKSALRDRASLSHFRASEFNRIHEAAVRYGIPVANRVVLDFGCHDGGMAPGYLREGASQVIGVDVDQAAIERARQTNRDERVSFVVSDVGGIPLDDASVDCALSCDVFEHVSKPVEILTELFRVMKPGGKVLIGTWSWRHPFAPHLWATMPVPWAHMFFSEKTILKVCRRVYGSPWYTPKWHDFDAEGRRMPDRYTGEAISLDYLNKYLISDFERAFAAAGFAFETNALPFGSRYATWTRPFASLPWFREFMSGYAWFVLTKPSV